jgi:hypothetical protein
MNPEVPDRERTPAPRHRWRPLDELDRRMSPGLSLEADVGSMPSSFEMPAVWSGP